jgi:two-component system, NtrC family, response regulator AtoC
MYTVLTVDDNEKLIEMMRRNLSRFGYNVKSALSIEEAKVHLHANEIDLVLLDLMLAGESGLDGLKQFLNIRKTLPVIILTGFATIESAVEAIKIGAYDYLQKPVDFNKLLTTIEKAIEYSNLKRENMNLRKQLLKSSNIFNTKSDKMLEVIEKARCFAETDLPVFITGESGTGKELLAEYIHENSSRSVNSLVKINSASFPESLLDNELFGHEKDSFTGASSLYKGVFEQANKSTLFLDEIGDMPMSLQAKILRTLQHKEIRRIGGAKTVTVDFRFITATNKDIPKLIEEGSFREDLFFRINTAMIHIPALRERKQDIPRICRYLINQFGRGRNPEDIRISSEVLDIFEKYEWPGNIRELKNIIQYALALLKGDAITISELPSSLINCLPKAVSTEAPVQNEKERIEKILENNKYNKKRTAEILGISRKTLYKKLEKYGID